MLFHSRINEMNKGGMRMSIMSCTADGTRLSSRFSEETGNRANYYALLSVNRVLVVFAMWQLKI